VALFHRARRELLGDFGRICDFVVVKEEVVIARTKVKEDPKLPPESLI
jgi:hypothetical protein